MTKQEAIKLFGKEIKYLPLKAFHYKDDADSTYANPQVVWVTTEDSLPNPEWEEKAILVDTVGIDLRGNYAKGLYHFKTGKATWQIGYGAYLVAGRDRPVIVVERDDKYYVLVPRIKGRQKPNRHIQFLFAYWRNVVPRERRRFIKPVFNKI